MLRIGDIQIGDRVSGQRIVYDEYVTIEGVVTSIDRFSASDGKGGRLHMATVNVKTDEGWDEWFGFDEYTRILGDPATQKQLDYLVVLNAWHEPTITKRQANRLINDAKTRVVDPALYYVKPIKAICELCGQERPVEEMADGNGGYDWNNPDEDFQGSVGLMSYRCADGTGCRSNRQSNAELFRMAAEIEQAGRYDDNSPDQIGGGKLR